MTTDDVLARADVELAKGNGAESCPICYSLIRDLAAEAARLRQRHAEAVEAAFREGTEYRPTITGQATQDEAWQQSEARKGVARDE